MRGRGYTKVPLCLEAHGKGFWFKPRRTFGLSWCRHCGYQVRLHVELESAALAEGAPS